MLVALVVYPLSYGPAVRFREYNPLSITNMCRFYAPIDWAWDHCNPFARVMTWYTNLYVSPANSRDLR